tara:strand:+ start:1152 stop:3110 length:1959 start_codon:yes stop_codon:yes gene_type:complete
MADRVVLQLFEQPDDFIGVSQTALDRAEYSSRNVNFFNSFFGLGGLGETGVGVDRKEYKAATGPDITTVGIQDDKDVDGVDLTEGSFESAFPGQTMDDISYDYSGGTTTYNSYSDALKGINVATDRVPMVENLFEPMLTKDRFGARNFKDVDIGAALFGEYERAETFVEEAPGKIGDIFKKGLTDPQKRSAISAAAQNLTKGAPMMGLMMGAAIDGKTVQNAFGNASWRPNGILGVAADLNHTVQFNDMANIRAAHASNAALQKSFDTGTLSDELTTGRMMGLQSFAPTGFAMEFNTGFGVTRSPGSVHYNGNTMGMSRSQLEAFDALSKGMVPKGYDPVSEKGTTINQAGWLATGNTGQDGKPGKGTGFYTDKGMFYSPTTNTYSRYGLAESITAAAAKAGITVDEYRSALTDARKGKGKLSNLVNDIRQTNLNAAEAARKDEAAKAAAYAAEIAKMEAAIAAGGGKDTSPGDDDFDTRTGAEAVAAGGGPDRTSGGIDSPYRKGGRVGYALGTPPPGVQAQQSGFIDAPPSQVSEAGKVADDRPLDVPEGTYILNAAAVEFAGETDIRNMILEAQKEAVRRGIAQGDVARSSEMVDIAVSRGEVKIAPYLVPIIGEDRLEKINKRGLRKTEQRIAATQQEPVAARRGGFI